VPGARLHGGERPRHRLAELQGVEDGGVAGALQVGVQRGLDDQALLLELLLGDPELLRHELLHEVADVCPDAGLDAAAPRRRGRREAEGGGRGLGLHGRGDVALGGHPREHLVAPDGGALGIGERVVVGGAAHQAGQQGGLGERQRGGVDTEEGAGGGLDPVRVLPEVDDVEVPGEQLLLAVLVLQRQGQPDLAQLAAHGVVGRGRPRLLAARAHRRLQEGLLDQLLGERGAALPHLARRHVGDERAQGALHVESAVLEEAGVLDGDQRVLHDLGDLVAGDRRPVLLVEVRDHLAVGGEQHGVAGRRFLGQPERIGTQQARRLLRGDRGTPDPGQEDAGEEGTGEHDGEGQRAQRADASRALSHGPPSDAGLTSTETFASHNPPRRAACGP
jgi:hypothetical protein